MQEEVKMRVVLTNILVDDVNKLNSMLDKRSLTKAQIARQIFKKFMENTDETIDFLFK
jgi:hypothetical protein